MIACVGFLYTVFGILGLQLVIHPITEGGVWPASGIALGLVLVWGYRIWPGIFIGSFIVSAMIFGLNDSMLSVCFFLAINASLAAVAGRYLIKRTIGFPNDLLEDKPIFVFLLIGGPVVCSIMATLDLAVMSIAGVVRISEIPFHWFVNWVGNSIGVFVFTPLALIVFASPDSVWGKRLIPVGVPLLLNFMLIIGFFWYVQKLDNNQHEQEFNNQTKILAETLKHRIKDHLKIVEVFSYLTIGDNRVTADGFPLAARDALEEYPEITAMAWLEYHERVENQADFVSVYSERRPGPLFAEVSAEQLGRLTKTLNSEPERQAVIEADHGRIHFLLPLYQPMMSSSWSLSAVVVSTVMIEALVAEAFEGLDTDGIYVAITGSDAESGYRIIFSNTGNHAYRNYRKYPLTLENLDWRFYFYQDSAVYAHFHWPMWWFLSGGLLFSSLLGAGLLMLTARHVKTELVVNQRTAELLSAKQLAETANKAKSQFLAKISHELRTPLNGIMGFTQLLQRCDQLPEMQKQQIDIIHHCGEDLLTLINDILDIAAIENNKTQVVVERFDFQASLNDIVQLFKRKAEQNRLQFIFHQENVPRYLYGDHKRVRQIISNLLENAVKYTECGSITLRVSYKQGCLMLMIVDTGCGMAEDHLNAIFSPFIQIHDKSASQEGLGIGLAICRELIKLMQGSINVESKLGQGTQFEVRLPLEAGLSNASETIINRIVPNRRSSRSKVLIADDNEINLLLLRQLLERYDCSVDCAIDGGEALAKVRQRQYDIAFIDLNMPVMNGFELVKQIVKEGFSLRLVAISAYGDRQIVKQAVAAGFNHYLTKPIDTHQLNDLMCLSRRIDSSSANPTRMM